MILFRTTERVEDPLRRQAAHLLHRLADSGEAGRAYGGEGYIIETDHRTVFGDAAAGSTQSTDRAECSEVVEGQDRRELDALVDHRRDEAMALLKSGCRFDGGRELPDALGGKPEAGFGSEALDPIPTAIAVGQLGGTAKDRDLAMTQLIQMPRGRVSASLVVHLQGAHAAGGKVASHTDRRDLVLPDIG